jgi:DnaK suppressor protein
MDSGVMTYFNEVLQERLRELLCGSGDLCSKIEVERNMDGPVDEVESAVARSQDEFRLHMRQRNRKLLLEVQEALRLIEDGEFGICLECGGNISIARLKVQPMTTVCLECKKEMEKEKKRIVAS